MHSMRTWTELILKTMIELPKFWKGFIDMIETTFCVVWAWDCVRHFKYTLIFYFKDPWHHFPNLRQKYPILRCKNCSKHDNGPDLCALCALYIIIFSHIPNFFRLTTDFHTGQIQKRQTNKARQFYLNDNNWWNYSIFWFRVLFNRLLFC